MAFKYGWMSAGHRYMQVVELTTSTSGVTSVTRVRYPVTDDTLVEIR